MPAAGGGFRMPFVQRDPDGGIVAVSLVLDAREEVDRGDADLCRFPGHGLRSRHSPAVIFSSSVSLRTSSTCSSSAHDPPPSAPGRTRQARHAPQRAPRCAAWTCSASATNRCSSRFSRCAPSVVRTHPGLVILKPPRGATSVARSAALSTFRDHPDAQAVGEHAQAAQHALVAGFVVVPPAPAKLSTFG